MIYGMAIGNWQLAIGDGERQTATANGNQRMLVLVVVVVFASFKIFSPTGETLPIANCLLPRR
jgi:hypothetical protein